MWGLLAAGSSVGVRLHRKKEHCSMSVLLDRDTSYPHMEMLHTGPLSPCQPHQFLRNNAAALTPSSFHECMCVLSALFSDNSVTVDLCPWPWQISWNMSVYSCDLRRCTHTQRRGWGAILRKENCTVVLGFTWMTCQQIRLNDTFWLQFPPPSFFF